MAVAAQPKKAGLLSVPCVAIDYLEAGYLLLFAVFLLTSWVGFTLAEFGIDRPLVVLALGAAGLLLGSALVFRQRWRTVSPGSIAGLIVPLLAGASLYFPPDEWILGDLDPGSYVNAGAAIARTGGIVLHSAALAALDPTVRQTLFPSPASRLPGFYLMFARFTGFVPDGFVVSVDQVVPHGFHLYPVVLSFGYAIGGVRSELLVTPSLALIGLTGFYLLARRLFGPATAAVATLFLSIGPAEVWFARYPSAEILVQLLLFGGLLAFVATVDTSSAMTSALAGLALGSVHLAKIEMLPLPFLVAAYLVYEWLIGRLDRRWFWFAIVYGALLVQAMLHATLIANWYAFTTLQVATSTRFLEAAGVLSMSALALLVSLLRATALRRRIGRLLTHHGWETPLAWTLPLLVGGLAIYAEYIRPLRSPAVSAAQLDPAQWSVVNNLQSFVRLGWYVTPLGLLLGTLGWMLIAHRSRDRRTFLPLLTIAVDTLVFLDDMKITPIHYWAARRWVPLVIPGICMAVAYLLIYLLPRERKRLIQAVVPAGLGLVMALGLVGDVRPLLGYVEYRGAIQQLGTLAAMIPSNGVALFADGDSGRRFSTPLEYIFGRTSFLIGQDSRMDLAAGDAARRWMAAGRPVYWISTAQLPDPSEIGLDGVVVARQTISLPEKLATRDQPPGQDGLFRQELVIWRLSER